MKNVTITLPEETIARLRVAAAQEGKSMSKFMADLVDIRLGHTLTQREALTAFLTGPDLPGIATERPAREDLYADRLLHRHERDAIFEGSAGASEASHRAKLDRRAKRA
jgi:plasmid stability protein